MLPTRGHEGQGLMDANCAQRRPSVDKVNNAPSCSHLKSSRRAELLCKRPTSRPKLPIQKAVQRLCLTIEGGGDKSTTYTETSFDRTPLADRLRRGIWG